MSDDVTKAALIAALPLLWLDSHSLSDRAIGAVVLAVIGYFAQLTSDKLRKRIDKLTRKD